MADPKPLTLCPPANIDFTEKSVPEAKDFGDIYFSTDGGAEETKVIFHEACHLPKGWEDKHYFAIGELGFGTGLNFLETFKLWNEQPSNQPGAALHYISVEKFPLDKKQLWEALKFWDGDLTLKMLLIKNWPDRIRGFHTLDFESVRLTLIHDEVLDGLTQISGKIDAWFLDGFSPSKNPDMWSLQVMQQLARLSSPGARLGTFTVARKVRDALTEAGFKVEKKAGFGRKRDRLEAQWPETRTVTATKTPDPIRPIIIGAGIAGASLAASFLRRGITPIVIDPNDDTAASGNPSAIVKPRLDLQDRPESRFFLSSYLYAVHRYQLLGCVLENTVEHRCLTDKEQTRYERLLEQSVLPLDHFAKTSKGNFVFPQSVIINPGLARSASLEGAQVVHGRAASFDGSVVLDENGEKLAQGTHVIWACGFGIRSLEQFKNFNLRYSRGQISWSTCALQITTSYGGYAIPIDADTILGATHKRLDDRSPFEARHEDDIENFEKFESALGVRPLPAPLPSRSSVRVTTSSTLPMIFGENNEWGLTGLGSRGFVFAPLLAEALTAKICGEVLPISEKVWARFQAREKAHPESAPVKTPDC